MKMVRILLILLMFLSVVQNATAAERSSGRKKTLAQKINEMEARQKGLKKAANIRDDRITSLESKLMNLEVKLGSQQNDKALAKKITQIEQKVLALENQSKPAQVVSSSNSEKTDVMAKLELSTQPFAAAPRHNTSPIEPIEVNFLDTTDVSSQESDGNDSKIVYNIWQCASPTNGFWGLNDKLAPLGIEVGLGLTSTYQSNAHGGTSTHDRRGRYVGRYDAEVAFDLEKLLGIEGGSFFLHGWGGWPDTEGVDAHSVGSAWGTSALAVGNRTLDIIEAFYEGPFFSDNFTIAVGKLDFTGIFDASEYADDECCQFLNASLVDDPTIPFPASGSLGIVLNWDITDSWYLMGGVADAQADGRETGFRTTFHDEDYFFYALETGLAHNDGNYRFGMWVDGQDKARHTNSQNHRDDVGFYTSCDKMLYKENSDDEDTQGLGGFLRYGWASSKYNELTNFFSLGLQYQGLLEGRDDDVLGAGYSHGTFSDDVSADYPEDYESVMEIYYNAKITPWLNISPSIQYVANPGGVKTAKDAVVFGVRAAMTF